jgi:CheY-like chemotaxis protein
MKETKKSRLEECISSLRILIVEDNPTTQLIYEVIFEDMVSQLIFANNGEEGFDLFIENQFDIIISDYDMPKLNGLEMIKKIRVLNRHIPIILISDIEDVKVITQALHLNITNFIKKPIINAEVIRSVENCAKILVAERYMQKQRDKELNQLKEIEKYKSYQENLAFSKELNIIRNDFYYKMKKNSSNILIDAFYQPLDTMSGDAYSIRKIDSMQTFYLLVDGMGKGLSASLSAMIMTSFVNHTIDIMIQKNQFNFKLLVEETVQYIKPILLDEESLSIDYILLDDNSSTLYYSKFSMPTLLMQTTNDNLIKLKSNNPPLSKWLDTIEIDSYNISNMHKILLYSDGIVENETINEEIPYAAFIEKDFLHSFTKEGFKERFSKKISTQEDDITFIFINKIPNKYDTIYEKTFDSALDALDEAEEWYKEIWNHFDIDSSLVYSAEVTFSELMMNAYEHGNLGIDNRKKHKMIEDNSYFDSLIEFQKNTTKKIFVEVKQLNYSENIYLLTTITDEGKGFDTHILSNIMRTSQKFNGRGVFVSKQNSLGIHYNDEGNSVLVLHKVPKGKQK